MYDIISCCTSLTVHRESSMREYSPVIVLQEVSLSQNSEGLVWGCIANSLVEEQGQKA